MLFLVIIPLVLIAYLEGKPLVEGRKWRELAVFTFLMALGAYLGIGQTLDFPIPNPTPLLEGIFRVEF